MEQHCSEEILSAYLDGDLESEEAGKAAEHLAECTVCRSALAHLRAIRDAASSMEQMVPPDRTWHAIQERIRCSKARSRRFSRLFWVGVPSLAAVVLVAVLVGRIRVATAPGHGLAAAAAEASGAKVAQDAAREYQEYVNGIDRAIDECRIALEENPGNTRVRVAFEGAVWNRQNAMDRLVSGGD